VPQWGRVKSFALPAANYFRPGPAPLNTNDLFLQRCEQLRGYSAALDDQTKMIAEYWEDGGGTNTPPGHWHAIAQEVSRRDNHTLDDDVKMFFALSNATMDAGIAVWEAKVFYDCVRPITALRYTFSGKAIQAWGGPGKGTVTMNGDDWLPYITTPGFSEYVSGHSTFSAAAAEILKRFTGSDRLDKTVTFAPGSSRIEPNVSPQAKVSLYWATFSDAADSAGLSRRIGGIHFEDADLRGRTIGRQIAVAVWEKANAYINGTAHRQ
jgi:hypothetical protein